MTGTKSRNFDSREMTKGQRYRKEKALKSRKKNRGMKKKGRFGLKKNVKRIAI